MRDVCRYRDGLGEQKSGILFFLPFLIFFLFLFFSGSAIAAPPPEVLFKVGQAVMNWDGLTPADLYGSVKEANPDLSAIESLEILDRVLKAGELPSLLGYARSMEARREAARNAVTKALSESRNKVFATYVQEHPEKARSLYGVAEQGALTRKDSGDSEASERIRCGVLGVDAAVAEEVQGLWKEAFLSALGASGTELLPEDFGVTLLSQRGEEALFSPETFLPLDLSGNFGSPVKEDALAKELALREPMARTRDLATREGVYEILFDEEGNLRNPNSLNLEDPEALVREASPDLFGDPSKLEKPTLSADLQISEKPAFEEPFGEKPSLSLSEDAPFSSEIPDLSAELEGLAETLQPGEVLQIAARVSGGAPPYRYAWSENLQASGGNARYEAEAPGKDMISLTVLDSRGKTLEIRKSLRVVPLEVRVEMLGIFAPQGSPYQKGAENIMAGDRVHLKGIASRRYPGMQYRWKAEGGVLFEGRTAGETVSLYRNDEGSAAITLEILSPRGALLGEGSYVFHVKQVRDPQRAKELLEQSREAWKSRDYSRALSLILQAERLDPENEEIRKTREKAEQYQEGQKRALELRRKAEEQIREGKLEEALASYRESLNYAEDPETRRRLEALREFAAKYRKAQDLWEQAASLQEHGYYEEALEKYREGLALYGDPRIEKHARMLEDYAEKAEALERRKIEKARQLWKEGAELQKQKRYEEALEKYRQGLEYYEDPRMEEHAAQLEAYLHGKEKPSRPDPEEIPSPSPEPTGNPRPSPSPEPTEPPRPSPTLAPLPEPTETPLEGVPEIVTEEGLSDVGKCGLAWEEVHAFGLVFEVPQSWNFHEGSWHTGNAENPRAVVGVVRETREEARGYLGFMNPQESRTVTLAGHSVTLHISREKNEAGEEEKTLALGFLDDPSSEEHVFQIGYALPPEEEYHCVAERFLQSFRFE